MRKNAYGMTAEDKRIVFMAVGIVTTVVVFLAVASAVADKSWSPLITVLQVGGLLLGTVVFFYYVISALWGAAKLLFPEQATRDTDDER